MPEILDVLNSNQATLQQIATALAAQTVSGSGLVHSAKAAGLADGAALPVWTPASGKRFRLQRLQVAISGGSPDTPYEVRDGATPLAWVGDGGDGATRAWLECGAPGYLATGADQALTLVNHAGVAINIAATAIGDEV